MFAYFQDLELQPPRKELNEGEDIEAKKCNGLRLLTKSPLKNKYTTQPFTDDSARHLYVVVPQNIKYMLEACIFGQSLPRRNICHSNLTGGGKAWCGGELWFASDKVAYISGASGRYPARNETELNEVAKIFVRYGFTTYSLGWNTEVGAPQRKYEKNLVKEIKDE